MVAFPEPTGPISFILVQTWSLCDTKPNRVFYVFLLLCVIKMGLSIKSVKLFLRSDPTLHGVLGTLSITVKSSEPFVTSRFYRLVNTDQKKKIFFFTALPNVVVYLPKLHANL